MKYYQEPNGDYLAVVVENGYRQPLNLPYAPGWRQWDARAAAIEHLPSSVQGTTVAALYLRECSRVKFRDIPEVWRRNLQGPRHG